MPAPRVLIAVAALISVTACAASQPSVYSAVDAQGFGYSDAAIEADRYLVTFRATSATDPNRAYDFALRRAAELTLEQGYDWFQVVSRRTDAGEARAPSRPSVSVGVGGSSGSYGSSTGVGVGVGFPVGGGASGRGPTAATLEIKLHRGAKPSLDPSAYEARAVLRAMAGLPPAP